MKPNQVYCVIDYETYSEAPLKDVGGWEYSVHPTTQVLCVAWRTGTRESLPTAKTYSWAQRAPTSDVRFLWEAIRDSSVIFVAHNAYFEQVITRNVLSRLWTSQRDCLDALTPERWICTASLAAALALPRKLEHTAKVMRLKTQKDMDGNRLILKWCKPRKPTKNNPDKRHSDPEEFARIVDYCKTDVDIEVELFLTLPPLSPTEREVWLLDQKINLRGFPVDRALVKTTLEMIAIETANLNARTVYRSFGELSTTNKRAALQSWLESNGAFLPNLQRKTIEDALASGMVTGEAAREMLEIRLSVSKTSTAKYEAFEQRSRYDGRVRDSLMYHGASTGRWSGSGVQIQNLPRGDIKDTVFAAEVMADGDLEMVRYLYGSPMNAFSSCTRSVITAPVGSVFDIADYNAIEARVLFWVADHESGMQAFRDGRDLYKELAVKIYRTKLDKVTDRQRFVGKTATLGAGFGLGHKRFRAACQEQGQEISEAEAKDAIDAYREEHAPVARLWKNLELAALSAVSNVGKRYSISHTTWYVRGEFLWCVLPSGRKLAYHKPSIRYEAPAWGGDKRPVVYHWGINPKTKQWAIEKKWGGGWVENCFSGDTLVLTSRGWIPIADVRASDRVYDGHEWVNHGGVLSQGEKEVGEWLSIRVTGNHLIRVGESWRSVMHMGESTVSASLELGRALVPWWLRHPALAKALAPFAAAIAGILPRWKRALLSAVGINAPNARISPEDNLEANGTDTARQSQIPRYSHPGYTDILVSFPVALIRSARRMLITAQEVSAYTRHGSEAVKRFLITPKLSRGGTIQGWISTESTITAGTTPVTSAWFHGQSTLGTAAIPCSSPTGVTKYRSRCFGSGIAPNGKAITLSPGTSIGEKPPGKLWRATRKRVPVYDIANCGPRHQFVVLTDVGPVIAHNCVQAIARDLMASAMLRIEATGKWRVVMSVHDELVAERDIFRGSTNADFCKLMATVPEWGSGIPVKVAGFESRRYKK